ncbi:MAG: restriction endonuclease subunit S [Proteocatella sp.]
MSYNYIKTPSTISLSTIEDKDYTLSSSQLMELVIPNENYAYVKDFLIRQLKRKDLGVEVGSLSYIGRSTHYFLRTKALQSHSFLPEVTTETALPIMPDSFVEMNLKEGDIIISKDSNIGEIAILDKDYPNYMLSGALYRLPVVKNKYYLLAFIKHKIFREQLDFMVPKGATIRHAKTLFLDCKIPLPNFDADNTIKFIEVLTQAIINKERLIKQRHEKILQKIETEIKENQKSNEFVYSLPNFNDITNTERLDTSMYCNEFQYWNNLVRNYKKGSIDIISRGFTWSRGTSLEQGFIGTRIDSDKFLKGFYELVLPTNISQYGYVEKSIYIGTPTRLKTIKKGDIIFGGEGFGKGRTYVVIDDTHNVATNYHGIRIINTNNNLVESIFIRCFLAFWRSKGMIDYIGVGGSGGHCAPSYFHLIETPLFDDQKQTEIAKLYHNPTCIYDNTIFTLDTFLDFDNSYNADAGIYELNKTAKLLKEILNTAIDNVVQNKKVKIAFNIENQNHKINKDV